MTEQQHPDYHEGFFDALDGEPLFEDECTRPYMAGWLAAHECRSYFDRQWEDVPAELQGRFPAHYARRLNS
jgi:hypothetical protein